MTHLLACLIMLFSFKAMGLAPQDVLKNLQSGLESQDQLLSFIQKRNCPPNALTTECQRPLTPIERSELQELILEVEEWRQVWISEILPANNLLKGLPAVLVKGSTHQIEEKTRRIEGTLKFEKYLLITYNPMELQSKKFFAQIRMHAASLVMMYDQFFRLSLALNETPRLRSVIENDIPQEKKWLSTYYQTAIDESRWKDSQSDIVALAQEEALRGSIELDDSELIFDSYVQQSFTAQRLRSKDETYRLGQILEMQRQLSSGRLTDRIQRLIGKISQIFGNSVGAIQTRDGKLKKLASDHRKMNSIKEKLKPLDILFEKTPMRLTDRFIPGFYGHVAIWIGPVSEWSHYFVRYQRAMIPITEHPIVKNVLPLLHESKGVLEALRLPGVTLNTIEHFMDIDDLLIIRQETLSEELKGEMIVKALEQYGKPYDFNFDVETQREIVCSELAYVVYNQETWPTSHQLGRYTISPDQVAFKVLDHHFDPILMYHDGIEVKVEMREKLRSLLEGPGGIAKFVN